jgi:hypothetical protein
MPRLHSLFLILSISLACGLSPLHPLDLHAETSMERGTSPVERGRQVERVRRFLQRTTDELNLSRKLTEEDIKVLENQYDSIPPGESAQREADLLSLLDTQYSYIDWIKDRIEEFDDDLEQLSAGNLPGSEFLENGFADMVSMLKDQEKVLDEKIDRFSAEEKRLAAILERQRLLQSRINDLETRLDRVGKQQDDKSANHPQKEEGGEHIRVELGALRSELDSLPPVDDDILMHYQLMIEQGKGESEWLALQIDEFRMLSEVAALLPRDTARYGAEMEKAMRRTERSYENEIILLNRKIDGVEKRRVLIIPVGTLRETEFSRDLADLYERLQLRYNDLIYRLRIRIGDWQAEEAQLKSAME